MSRKQGALATDPQRKGGKAFALGTDQATLQRQLADQQKKLGNSNDKGRQARIASIQKALGQFGTDPQPVTTQPVSAQPSEMEQTNQMSNDALQGLFGRIQGQGEFNPGSFSDMRLRAEQSVMDSFNRNMQPQFQQEEQQFRQQMAEQGIPETSELYQRQFNNLKNTQNNARLNAQNQAFTTGQSEQALGYQQAADRFNMPYAQLGALQPFYADQNQTLRQQAQNAFDMDLQRDNNQFIGRENQLNRKNDRWLLKNRPTGGGGGGGGLSFEQQRQLQSERSNADLYNSLALMGVQNGNQPRQPGMGGSFWQGVGNGASAIIGSALRS